MKTKKVVAASYIEEEVFEQSFSRLPYFDSFPGQHDCLRWFLPTSWEVSPHFNMLPSLKLTANAPENQHPRGIFIFQPSIFRGELLVSGRLVYSFPTRASKWNSDPGKLSILKHKGDALTIIWDSGSPLHPRVFFLVSATQTLKHPFF